MDAGVHRHRRSMLKDELRAADESGWGRSEESGTLRVRRFWRNRNDHPRLRGGNRGGSGLDFRFDSRIHEQRREHREYQLPA